MKNRKKWLLKKGLTMLLSASMIFSNSSILALAEDQEAVEVVAEVVTEAPAPETDPPAPETDPPVPETEAPAPETEAPAPETEAPAPETEAPVPETEVPAPETEAPETEKKTEAPSEKKAAPALETEKKDDSAFIVKDDKYTISVEFPKELKLPEGSELTAKALRADSDEMKKALVLLESEKGYQLENSKIYDIHMEKDKKEVEISKRVEKDIKVTITFADEIFRGEKEEDIRIYHLRDMTEDELQKAKEENESGGEVDDARALDLLKAELKWNDTKTALCGVTFKTDGFSDYAITVMKEQQEQPTETPTEVPTETPTEVPTETPTEVPTETPTEVPTEAPTETPTEVPTEAPTETPTETPTESPTPTETPVVKETADITLTAIDKETGGALGAVTYTVNDSTGKEVAKAISDEKGELLLEGVLKKNTVYTVKQSAAAGHYAPAEQKITVSDEEKQTFIIKSSPTLIKIAVMDSVSDTSTRKGQYVAGATIEIRYYKNGKIGDLIKTVKSINGVLSLKGELNADDYILIQTDAPAGYIKDTYGKQRSLKKKEKEAIFNDDTVKVQVTRKGYDERVKKKDGGYEYKNLKPIDGSVLEIRSKGGEIVKDKDGNPVRWTSNSSESGYMIEGILEAGKTYTIKEIQTPIAYEPFNGGEFTTFTSGNIEKVALPTRKGSGKITIALKSSAGNNIIKMNGRFYCAVYTDPECRNRLKQAGIKMLEQKDDAIYSTVLIDNLPSGVYYISECDSAGNAISKGDDYSISYENKELHLKAGGSLLGIITHTYEKKPDGSKETTKKEQNSADNGLFSGFGGSSQAASEMAAGETSVKTGDATNPGLYVEMLSVAFFLMTLLFFMRRKRS